MKSSFIRFSRSTAARAACSRSISCSRWRSSSTRSVMLDTTATFTPFSSTAEMLHSRCMVSPCASRSGNAPCQPSCRVLAGGLGHARHPVGRGEGGHVLADQRLRGALQQAQHGRVQVDETPVQVQRADTADGLVVDRAEACLALAQRALGGAGAQQRGDRGHQHGRLGRVDQVGAGAGVQAAHLVVVGHVGGGEVYHRHGGGLGALAQAAADLEAVDVRQVARRAPRRRRWCRRVAAPPGRSRPRWCGSRPRSARAPWHSA